MYIILFSNVKSNIFLAVFVCLILFDYWKMQFVFVCHVTSSMFHGLTMFFL